MKVAALCPNLHSIGKLPHQQWKIRLDGAVFGPFWISQWKITCGSNPNRSPDYDTLKLTQEEISERRAAAERDLTNISPEERERRAEVAQVALKVCGGYAIFSSLVLDNGDIGGHFARFLVIFPLFVYRGYDLSAKSGL